LENGNIEKQGFQTNSNLIATQMDEAGALKNDKSQSLKISSYNSIKKNDVDSKKYLNLECQNEQLKILIEKLHKITDQKGLSVKNPNYYNPMGKIPFLSSFTKDVITSELKTAKELNAELEETIISIKNGNVNKLS
jgi:hypothetical protein